MKRLLLLIVGLSLASSLNGCCWRNRCCRPACDPCGGGGGMMGAPQQTIPYGAVPTGSLTPNYGAVAPATTSAMPVASTTTTAMPMASNTTYYPSAQMGYQAAQPAAPTVAGLPVNPLPTF